MVAAIKNYSQSSRKLLVRNCIQHEVRKCIPECQLVPQGFLVGTGPGKMGLTVYKWLLVARHPNLEMGNSGLLHEMNILLRVRFPNERPGIIKSAFVPLSRGNSME